MRSQPVFLTDFKLETSILNFGGILAAPLSGLAAATFDDKGVFIFAIALVIGHFISITVLVKQNTAQIASTLKHGV